MSVTDEQLAQLVRAERPKLYYTKCGKLKERWDIAPFRTAWKHPNAGPLVHAALIEHPYWAARSVGLVHYKWHDAPANQRAMLHALAIDPEPRVKRYILRHRFDITLREWEESLLTHLILSEILSDADAEPWQRALEVFHKRYPWTWEHLWEVMKS
jgi:hypothetical protein